MTSSKENRSLENMFRGNVVERLKQIAGKEVMTERTPRLAIATQTGVISIDMEIGGGLPAGLIELFGDESVGKTALLGQTIAFAQQTGLETMLLASELFDHDYYKRLGVDLTRLVLVPGGTDDPEEVMLQFLVDHPRSLLGIDSITALRFEDEQPGEWNECMFGMLQRLKEQTTARSCVVVVSQVRARRSADHRRAFAGGTESASRRLTDLFSLRLELSRQEVTDKHYSMLVNVVRNTLAQPASLIEVPAEKGAGIDVNLDLIRVARKLGLIERRGPQYYFKEFYLGIGERGAADTLVYDPDIQLRIFEAIASLTDR
jgi:recombination protein RecA